jgi:hypothetical protein
MRVSNHVITIWKAPSLACEELHDTAEKVQAGGSLALTLETTTTHPELVASTFLPDAPSLG